MSSKERKAAGSEKAAAEEPPSLETCKAALGDGFSDADAAALHRWASKYEHLLQPQPEGAFEEAAKALEKLRKECKVRPFPSHLPDGRSTDFNKDFVPLSRVERAARRGLISQWVNSHDPYVAAEMRAQEEREVPYAEVLASIYGQDCDLWRIAMQLEAKTDRNVRREYSDYIAGLDPEKEAEELQKFSDCARKIQFAETAGPFNKRKAIGLLYVCRFFLQCGIHPSQVRVRNYLISAGYRDLGERDSTARKNEARDIFNGPIMGELPKSKGGHPKRTQKPGES